MLPVISWRKVFPGDAYRLLEDKGEGNRTLTIEEDTVSRELTLNTDEV